MEFSNEKIAFAGNKGKGIRSDCFVTLELTSSGGLQIEIQSKVAIFFGEEIKKTAISVLNYFDIKNAKVLIEDTGAIDCVITARLEATIKMLVKTEKVYLPEMYSANTYSTTKDRNRFSRLYLPGNSPSLMLNAGVHKPNGIILDLEDAVAVDKKFEARFLVRNALRAIDFYGAERMVRINQIPQGLEDLDYIVPNNVNLILVPKCEEAEQIHILNNRINELKKQYNITNQIWLMPIIESAKGVMNAYQIALSAPNIVSMAIGLEDYTADLGTRRTNEATESFFARSVLVNACRAAGLQPIDSVFSDIADMDALKENVLKSKALGFDGMGCIHPRQIKVIHEYFAPDSVEIDKARKIVLAFDEATANGLGVVSLGTKMIDPPVVKRAIKTIDLAINMGKLSKDWRNEA